jgi:hypothetical protein
LASLPSWCSVVPGEVPLGSARLPPRRRDAEKTQQIDNLSASQRLCGKFSPYPETKSSHSSDPDRGHETIAAMKQELHDAIMKAKSRRAEADGCYCWPLPSWCSVVPGEVLLGRARLPPRRRDAEKTKQIDNLSASQRLSGKFSPYPDTKSSHSSDSDRGHETGTPECNNESQVPMSVS